jgi:predicted glycoside hydrolase/deacetylase ChbG (UPF0249 family)
VSQQLNTESPERAQQLATACNELMNRIGELYKTNVRVHAAHNVPAAIMAASLNKLNNLFNAAQMGYESSNFELLDDVANQLKHFDEPPEVKSHFDQQYLQRAINNNR